jgi:hypothetical protein
MQASRLSLLRLGGQLQGHEVRVYSLSDNSMHSPSKLDIGGPSICKIKEMITIAGLESVHPTLTHFLVPSLLMPSLLSPVRILQLKYEFPPDHADIRS